MAWNKMVPFTLRDSKNKPPGDLIFYLYGWQKYHERRWQEEGVWKKESFPVVWLDIFEFVDTLRLVEWTFAKQSAGRMIWQSAVTGYRYEMFMKHVVDTVRHPSMQAGIVTAKWTFEKTGQNYSLVLAEH